jgi:hypothetical protein
MNLNLMAFPPEQVFMDRAVRMSCFGGGPHMAVPGQLSRVSSSQSLISAGITGGTQLEGELALQENGGGTNNGRKRKAGIKGKGKDPSLATSGTADSKVSVFFFSSLRHNVEQVPGRAMGPVCVFLKRDVSSYMRALSLRFPFFWFKCARFFIRITLVEKNNTINKEN